MGRMDCKVSICKKKKMCFNEEYITYYKNIFNQNVLWNNLHMLLLLLLFNIQFFIKNVLPYMAEISEDGGDL